MDSQFLSVLDSVEEDVDLRKKKQIWDLARRSVLEVLRGPAHLVLLPLHLLSQVELLRLQLVDAVPHLFGSLPKSSE